MDDSKEQVDPMGILDVLERNSQEAKEREEQPGKEAWEAHGDKQERLKAKAAAEQEEKDKKPESPPDPNRHEVSIVWLNGQVMMKGPGNPIMLMKVLGDALSTAADEYLQIAQNAKAEKIMNAGPKVDFTPETAKIIKAVQNRG